MLLEKHMKSRNPNFIRTDKAIIQAFIQLLNEKPFEKITVQNILDKTPVTRATFYAHFHDKYEIAEKMQSYFLEISDSVREELKNTGSSQYEFLMKRYLATHRDLTEALLKIHTEKVDIRQAIADKFEHYYITLLNPKASASEARIYGLIRAELELSAIYDESIITSFANNNELTLSITMNLLRLADDDEVWNYLRNKLEQKFYRKKESLF